MITVNAAEKVGVHDGKEEDYDIAHWRGAKPTGWWRGVVGTAFRLKRSYSTPVPVSTAIGDCLRAGKPSRCEACQLS